MKKIIVLGLIAALVCAASLSPRQIETKIVQVKLDRIYFNSGIEEGVKSGAQFDIECEGRDIITGMVEYAGPGISYSFPLAELDSLEFAPGCIARLASSDVDSTARITIGIDIPYRFFDPEHETLFMRTADTVLPNLVDSMRQVGNTLMLYMPRDVRFSDGSLFTAETLAYFLDDIRERSRSYPVRYFFSRMMPIDSGGFDMIEGYIVRLSFYQPFPRAAYFLSHPDFAVYNRTHAGTGPLVESPDPESRADKRIFVPNRYYRGEKPAFSRMAVIQFEQQYRMKFAYESGQIDGFIGFGFEADLAGMYEAKALYPEVAVMVAGIGGELFSQAIFPTSLYYCFNPDLAHIYFQYGDVAPVNRWLIYPTSDAGRDRFYPFDFLGGRKLHSSLRSDADTALLAYDHSLLYETARYLADIVAREGMTAPISRRSYDERFDIRLAFFPASDKIMPFALIAAVLEFNDQNQFLPPERRFDRPGWQDMGSGSRLNEVKNRNTFFVRAEETVVQDGGFFPLYRPYIYAVSAGKIRGLDFDFYGYPILDKTVKFDESIIGAGRENR